MIGRVTRHYLRHLYAQEYEEYHRNMLWKIKSGPLLLSKKMKLQMNSFFRTIIQILKVVAFISTEFHCA